MLCIQLGHSILPERGMHIINVGVTCAVSNVLVQIWPVRRAKRARQPPWAPLFEGQATPGPLLERLGPQARKKGLVGVFYQHLLVIWRGCTRRVTLFPFLFSICSNLSQKIIPTPEKNKQTVGTAVVFTYLMYYNYYK